MKSILFLLFLVTRISRSDVNVQFDMNRGLKPVEHSPQGKTTLQILTEVLFEATSPYTDVSSSKGSSEQTNNYVVTGTKSKWRRRIRQSLGSVATALRLTTGLAIDVISTTIASAAMAAASLEQESRSFTSETCPVVSELATKKPKLRAERTSSQQTERTNSHVEVDDMSFDSETIQGAKLIAASFGILGNTLGLIADSIRISGDTAAGILGSTVKVVGSAVQTLSTSFDNAGRLIEPHESHKGRKRLTSERLLYKKERRLAGGEDENFERRINGFFLNSRHITSKGMRLVGNVVRGLGDSLVLVGGATESLASSTVGLAEDSVRMFEDVAGSIAASLIPMDPKTPMKVKLKEGTIVEEDDDPGPGTNSLFSFGSNDDQEYLFGTNTPMKTGNVLINILERYQAHFIEFIVFVFDEIHGVPSLAPEIFGILGICYFTCLYWISRAMRERNMKIHSHVPKLPAAGPRGGKPLYCPQKSILTKISPVLVLPFKGTFLVVGCIYRVVLDRRIVLLYLFTFAWAYLSWASQIRSFAIQRHAEGKGFRSAIASIGTTVPSRSEPVLWVNALFNQIWQTRGPESKKPTSGKTHPIFVDRAMKRTNYENQTCHTCPQENGECPEECFIVFGGLEPIIAGIIGNYFMEVFQASKSSGPTDVAYVSIHSITLGSQPPLIRGVELLGKERGGERYEYELDVLFLFEDMEIILDVKLSNLDYALLPTTKISVHSFEAVLPLKVSVASTHEYPYISTIDFSLSKSPECNIRITPLSDDSGLRGIDLGSLPVIREWIQRVIHDTFSDYVAPKFVSFDYAAWMTLVPENSVSPVTDISLVQQKAQCPVNYQSSSHGATITSKAIQSRQPAGHTAFFNDKHVSTSLVRPNTELSKLGMERWLAKIVDPEISTDKDITQEKEGTSPLPRILAQPLALLSPILLAVAAVVLRANTANDKSEA